MRRTGFLLLCLVILPLGCVSEVELDATPCPCGAGFQCCPSLGLCLDQTASCPESYPPSSAGSCTRDDDCPRNEACHAWSLDGQPLAGPRQCRRTCDDASIPCADGERCQLAPHDAILLQDQALIPLCLTTVADSGPLDGGADGDGAGDSCDPWSCQDCPPDRVGKTFCDGTTLYGCLIATHPSCGIRCEKVQLKQCSTCTESGGVVTCEEFGIAPQDPCLDLPCSSCPADQLTFCDAGSVSTCLRLPYEGETCNEVCQVQELVPCPGTCAESSGQAACAD